MRPTRIRRQGDQRLCDAISFRISPEQRTFLENIAEERGVNLCEACRIVVDEAMARRKGGNA